MKRFTSFSKLKQWTIAISFTIVLLVILSTWVETTSNSSLSMLLIFIMVPVIQFLATPIFTVTGFYTYYSPMVVSMGSNKEVIDLHNGTSFDYLLEMSKVKPGIRWKNKMLSYYLKALLYIIQKIEAGELLPNTTIRGSSYFLSERSAAKLGFQVKSTSMGEKLNIVLNYLDLIWMYSLTNGKLTFPNLRNITTVSISGDELLERKGKLLALVSRLDRSSAS